MKHKFLLVLLLCMTSCVRDAADNDSHVDDVEGKGLVSVPPPPDVGDVKNFHSCMALPRRKLADKEVCQIDRLRRRCLPSDDCLITCLSSPDSQKVGGGCDHVCFSYLHKKFVPPDGYGDCK